MVVKKIRIGMWNSRPPLPFMEKNILNFHFDYLHPSLIWIKGAQIGSNMPSALGLVTGPTAVLKKVSKSTLEGLPPPQLGHFSKERVFFSGTPSLYETCFAALLLRPDSAI